MFGNPALALLLTFAFLALLLAALVGGLVLLGFGLPLFGRTRWRPFLVVPALLLLGLVALAWSTINRPEPRIDVALDLSSDHSTAQLQGTPVGGLYIYEGDVNLDLRLPGQRTYTGKATLVTCSVKGDTIEFVSVSLPAMSRDRAQIETARLMDEFGIDRSNLAGWFAGNEDIAFTAGSRATDVPMDVRLQRLDTDRFSLQFEATFR